MGVRSREGARSLRTGLRRRWRILVPLALLAGVLGYVYASQQTDEYTATARVEVKSFDNLYGARLSDGGGGDLSPNRVIATQADVVSSRAVVDDALRRAGLPADGAFAEDPVSAVTGLDSNILGIEARWDSEDGAVQLANGVADAFVAFRGRLDTEGLISAEQAIRSELARLDDTPGANQAYQTLLQRTLVDLRTRILVGGRNTVVVERADEATLVGPRPLRTAVLAAVGIFVLGLLVVWVLEFLDTRVRDSDEVAEILGAPLLGSIARRAPGRNPQDGFVTMLHDPDGREAEGYRVVSSAIRLSNAGGDTSRMLLIASAAPEEGKSTVASNLGVALARSGASVIACDLDLRQPRLTRTWGLQGLTGMTDVIRGDVNLDGVLAESADDLARDADLQEAVRENGGRFAVIPSGPLPPNPGDFVNAPEIAGILGQIRDSADVVILDAPAWLAVGDAFALARHADSVVVVVRASATRRQSVERLAQSIRDAGARILGFVFIADRAGSEDEGIGYGSYYAAYDAQGARRRGETAPPRTRRRAGDGDGDGVPPVATESDEPGDPRLVPDRTS